MAKGEISWKREDEDGGRLQVAAICRNHNWVFQIREKRFDNWKPHPEPPLEDWLALLDGVRRRVQRRLIPLEAEGRLVRQIQERFPEAAL